MIGSNSPPSMRPRSGTVAPPRIAPAWVTSAWAWLWARVWAWLAVKPAAARPADSTCCKNSRSAESRREFSKRSKSANSGSRHAANLSRAPALLPRVSTPRASIFAS